MNNTIGPDALSKLTAWQLTYLGKIEPRVLVNKITALALSNADAGVSVLRKMATSETLSHAVEVITANLGKTGTLIVGVIGSLGPILVITPIFWLLGFGNTIRAGSIAVFWMASIGNVVRGSLYATIQSAAAGGWGVVRVAGGVQSLSVMAVVLVLLKIYQSQNKAKGMKGISL